MQGWRTLTIGLLLVGGPAVIGSYVHGVVTAPGKASALWGGVPKPALPAYTAGMFLAAAGFLLFTYYLVFLVDAGTARFAFGLDYRIVPLLYVLILIPSALWMSLTIAMVDNPSARTWLAIRLVLFAVGLAALGIVALLLTVEPRVQGTTYWAALLGAVAFFIHTGILDALVWPAYFPR